MLAPEFPLPRPVLVFAHKVYLSGKWIGILKIEPPCVKQETLTGGTRMGGQALTHEASGTEWPQPVVR